MMIVNQSLESFKNFKSMKGFSEDFPRGPVGKNLPANAVDTGLIPWSGKIPDLHACCGTTKPIHHSY